jgi:hypothetical protein
MLTREILLGMNILTLGGFVLMGLGLTFTRQGTIRVPVAYALMAMGTALVFIGLYAAVPATP